MNPMCRRYLVYLAAIFITIASGATLLNAQESLLPSSLSSSYSLVALYGVEDQGLSTQSAAVDVNDDGDAVGLVYVNSAGVPHARAAIWRRAGDALGEAYPTVLTDLGGDFSSATGINSSGMIIGDAFTPGSAGRVVRRAVVWQRGPGSGYGVSRDIGSLDFDHAHAGAVSDTGIVVGYVWSDEDHKPYAYSWTATGGMKLLTGGTGCIASAVNELNRIVGSCGVEISGGLPTIGRDAVIWDQTGNVYWMGTGGALAMSRTGVPDANPEWIVGYSDGFTPREFFPYIDLLPFSGAATGANRLRHVVGYFAGPSGAFGNAHGFFRNGGVANDLNFLIPVTEGKLYQGWGNLVASRVNDRGWIVGTGVHALPLPSGGSSSYGVLIRPGPDGWCGYDLTNTFARALSPDYVFAPPEAGVGNVAVSTRGGGTTNCAWAVTKVDRSTGIGDPWLSMDTPGTLQAPAQGDGTVQLAYERNDTGAWRFGQTEIAGHHFWVAQTAANVDVSDAAANLGNESASITVSLSSPLVDAANVFVRTADGTAHAGTHFTNVFTTVPFSAGSTEAQVTIPVAAVQGCEPSYFFVIAESSDGPLTMRRRVGTVRLPATMPSLTVEGVSAVYGGEAALTAHLQGGAGGASDGQVVDFSIGGRFVGTATTDVSGTATVHVPLAAIPAGTSEIRASYSGCGDSPVIAASTITITPASLIITVNDASRVFGHSNPTFPVRYSGFVTGEGPEVLEGVLAISTDATAASHPASYPLAASGVTAPNYAIAFVPGTLTVTKATISASFARGGTFAFDGHPHPAGVSLMGVFNEDLSVLVSVTYSPGGSAPINAGTYSVLASFAGTVDYEPATDTSAAITIAPAVTSTTAAAQNAAVFGEPVAVTVGVLGGGPASADGGVSILVDGQLAGLVALQAAAAGASGGQFLATGLTIGSHTIAAVYPGSTNFAASSASAMTVTVNRAATAVVLTTSPEPSGSGEPVVLTANVTPVAPGAGAPRAVVEFLDNGVVIGSASLSLVQGSYVATVTTSSMSVGAHTLSATYAGDENFIASAATASHTVNSPKASTTTMLQVPASAAIVAGVTLDAVVGAASGSADPTGSVEFSDGGVVIGTAPLQLSKGAMHAVLTTTFATLGAHQLVARYVPDAGLSASASAPASITIYDPATGAPVPTQTDVSAPKRVVFGDSVALTITVTPGTPPKKTPLGGTVDVFLDGQRVAQAAVSAQAASVTLTGLARGSHEIVALFTSDSVDYSGSTSRAVSVSVR